MKSKTMIRTRPLKLQTNIGYYITILLLCKQSAQVLNDERQTIQSYCKSFKSCHSCKIAAFQCEWCHNQGCTNQARLHCPKKVFLDNVWKRDSADRFCTEIIAKSPIFVPANVRRFIKLEVRVDDLTLYEKKIVCEMHVEGRVIRVAGSLDKNVVYCDTMILKIHEPVSLGYMRLYWGGAEPYSNMILVIIYNCHNMGRTCKACQALNKEFKCGWCQDTFSCSLIQECPRQYGLWIDKNLTCEKRIISQNKLPQG